MAQDPDDKRAYFQRIVDDITAQIQDGRLQPNDPLPSARKMADIYGVASMTAQRALRELQHLRITYGVPGKGTFIHPDAIDVLRGDALREPIDDPDLRQRVTEYLANQQQIITRLAISRPPAERDAALAELLAHAERHRDLIDEAIKYQSDANFAKDPFANDASPSRPARRSASRRKQRPASARRRHARPRATAELAKTNFLYNRSSEVRPASGPQAGALKAYGHTRPPNWRSQRQHQEAMSSSHHQAVTIAEASQRRPRFRRSTPCRTTTPDAPGLGVLPTAIKSKHSHINPRSDAAALTATAAHGGASARQATLGRPHRRPQVFG